MIKMSNSKINIKNLEEVRNSLNSKSLKVCVIGIGRIGLPTALSLLNQDYKLLVLISMRN